MGVIKKFPAKEKPVLGPDEKWGLPCPECGGFEWEIENASGEDIDIVAIECCECGFEIRIDENDDTPIDVTLE